MTQNGVISFFSSTPVEDIEAINNQVSAVVNTENGELAAVLLMKAFNFEKALMQEHFNEKYVESDKFPKSVFKGKIVDFDGLEVGNDPVTVMINGELTIHGVTNAVEVEGTISKNESVLNLSTTFNVLVADYDIKIPGAVKENIAKSIAVNVKLELNKM
jgi:polyisoprenoid-binding protein YceI